MSDDESVPEFPFGRIRHGLGNGVLPFIVPVQIVMQFGEPFDADLSAARNEVEIRPVVRVYAVSET